MVLVLLSVGAYDGKIKADQFKAQLDKFAAKISKKN